MRGAGQRAGWVDLDEVALGAGYHAELHAHAGNQIGTSAELLTISLHYGNRGDASATGASLALTLPSELTLVSANPAPATTGPSLIWQVGELPRGAGATIEIVAEIAAGTLTGSLLEAPFGITVAQGEIETTNNAGSLAIFVGGRQIFLPTTMH